METYVQKIEWYANNEPHLCHANCLLNQYEQEIDNAKKQKLLQWMQAYVKYLDANFILTGYTDDIIKKRVNALNKYYNFVHNNGWDNLYNPQTKVRPTILEEFLFILFNDLVSEFQEKHKATKILDSGSAKSYTNLYFKAKNFECFIDSPEVAINVKDQDFAIYRKFDIAIDNNTPKSVVVPALAIEAKTFIDKTMLDSIIATAEKVKSGNPYARFVAVSEKYDVGATVDPAYSRIDQIYILRKCGRKEWEQIDENVVCRLFLETKNHLERPWSDVQQKMKTDGVII